MNIGLVTDSTCDLEPNLLNDYNIEMVPLTINFTEDEVYKDIIDIKQKVFFQKLSKVEKLPTTSQPSIGLFVEKYREMADKYDVVISIHLASKLSGTYHAAKMAAKEIENLQIEIIDSSSASLGIGYQLLYAKRLIDEGMSFKEIVKRIKNIQRNLKIFFTVNDLTYLQMGGRLGKAQAFLGSVLNFYPVLGISEKNGEILPLEKVRGKRKIVKRMIELVMEEIKDEKDVSLGFVHGSELNYYDLFKENLFINLADSNINYIDMTSWMSSVIGCHVGPSVYGIVILKGESLGI